MPGNLQLWSEGDRLNPIPYVMTATWEALNKSCCRVPLCTGSATGRAILGGWGFGVDEVAEVRDSLYDLAQSYEEEDGI